ncbi:hypothetical protein [Asticcacaulis sp.]|uniref:hypothetical protein n=1 Tax=Asticcacaulis sp. TaxID=1872648 RepID=UPI002614F5D0|nr:hypothetical protein [Asticcacaulis sp.]
MTRLSTAQLKTPARVFTLVRSETAFGGATETRQFEGITWGDFTPRPPSEAPAGEGVLRLRQYAEFTCRSAAKAVRGSVLSIRGEDWTVLSVSSDADGQTLITLERRR